MTYPSTLTALLDSNSGYYRLGEASGTTMGDSSGNSHSGTYSGTITLGATGLLAGDSDTALSLSGSGNGVVSHAAWQDRTTLHFAAWFSCGASGSARYLGSRGSSGANFSWSFGVDSSGRLFANVNISGTQHALGPTLPAGGSLRDSATHFAVLTYDGTTVSLYIDGSLLTSGSFAGSMQTPTGSLVVGVGPSGSGGWFGVIDEASYGPPLTSTQVASLYTAGTTSGTPVTVTPPAATATAAALAPTVSATKNVTVTPPAATAAAAALAPVILVGGSVTILPPAATATAAALAPTVSAQRNITINPPAATATADAPAPTVVIGGAGDVTVLAALATANARLLLPLVLTNATGPLDDDVKNAGALMPGGWSTTSYLIDPPSSTGRRDIPAVHYEPGE